MTYQLIYDGFNEASLVVRTSVDPVHFALPVQRILFKLDRDLGVADVMTLEQVLGQSVFSQSFEATLVTGFAALSLLLASIGLYGVLSYLVAQRTGELGIRIALGAQRGALIRGTLFDGIKPALFGLLFGVAGGVGAARLMQSLLFGIAPTDLSVFFAVPAVVLLVAVAACALPAVRASAVDPLTALRVE